MKLLIYTIAVDNDVSGSPRLMAKMLTSSLLRSYVGAEIMVFRASADPLFRVECRGLTEVVIAGGRESHKMKYLVKEFMRAVDYDWGMAWYRTPSRTASRLVPGQGD